MTIIRRDGKGSPFGHWLRNCPELDSIKQNLSCPDVDWWIHGFPIKDQSRLRPVDHIMLIELKTFSAEISFAQRDTLNVIDSILRKASVDKNGKRRCIPIRDKRSINKKSIRLVRWLGVHVLSLSNERPDNSSEILWDGRVIDTKRLIGLLRFDFDPDSPFMEFDRRRHHLIPRMEAIRKVQTELPFYAEVFHD